MNNMKTVFISTVLIVAALQYKSVFAAECSPGFYTSGNTSCGCLECPAGYSCAGGNNTGKNPCSPGQYSPLGQSSCTDCEPGSYSSNSAASSCTPCAGGYHCPAASILQYSCPGGTYSTGGADTCLPCPAGESCANTSAIPVPCDEGEWSASGQTSCSKCSSGSECPDKTHEVTCPIGTFSPYGDSKCHNCPSGQYAATAGSSDCSLCTAGSQCSDPTTTPQSCPEGTYSDIGASNCTACPDGTISSNDHTQCDMCPGGHECRSPSLGAIPCPAGYYSALGDDTCTICSAGYYCSIQADSQTACPANQYADINGQQLCMDCPAGFSCTADSKTRCVAGEYSPSGDSTCHSCPAGKYCPEFASSPISCLDGTYSIGSTTDCTLCPAGHECIDLTSFTPCGSGNYSLGGQKYCGTCGASDIFAGCPLSVSSSCGYGEYDNSGTCETCQPGEYCADPSNPSPGICPEGTYSDVSGALSCTVCPAGYECPTNTARGKQCDLGTYSTGNAKSCSPCAAGSYCPYINQAVEIPCALGTYATENSSKCETCPAGKECPDPKTEPDDCPVGSYSQGAATACTPCPAGFACPSTDTRSDSYKCPVGSYSTGSESSCTPCPAGKFCPLTDANIVHDCPDGFTSPGNLSSCIQCPAGFKCPDKTDEEGIPCDPGTYSLGGQLDCTPCPVGYECPSPIAGPIQCAPGYYADSVNTANCTACPAGSQCSDPAISPVQCSIGTYSYNSSVVCLPCRSGYKCSAGAVMPNPPDDICEPGNWCDGKDSYQCPKGTYIDRDGGRTELDCNPCHPGYYCDTTGATSGNSTKCPAGYYCLEGTSDQNQFPCPGGTYNDTEGLGTEDDCSICPAGQYCEQGEDIPLDCLPGFYCVAGQTNAYRNPCPPGTYSDNSGLTNATECTECPVGHYCPYGSQNSPSISPLECPPGTYNPMNGSIDRLSCVECDAGKACNISGLEFPNQDCDQGHYCPLGTAYPSTYPCQPGTYTNETNLERSEDCYPCPAGYYCTLGTVVPRDCWEGYYCPKFTPTPTRYACPPGTYSNQSRNEKLQDCSDCVPGYYCSGGESDVSGICPPGYYCLVGTAAANQYPCPNATYNLVYNQDEEDDCQPCTQGHYCEKGTVEPVECPLGTYMPYGATTANSSVVVGSPAGRESDCLECPAGSLCKNGVFATTGCGKGFYSKAGNSECETCLAGYYCDNETTSYDDMINNKKCPAGYYCKAGLTTEADKTDCRKAYYCPEETPVEIPCPTGTFNPDPTKGSITDCLACTAGYFCLEGSWLASGDCNPGYYCPTDIPNVFPDTLRDLPLIGSYGPEQIACPGGTYRNSTNGEVVEDCDICPKGNYCPLASVNPIECPQGYYCIDGLEVPTPCREGTYGHTSGLMAADNCTLCDPGYFCDSQGLISPRGKCDAGYLCYLGAIESNPTDNVTGVVCPSGGYCPQGSYTQQPCPPGTYSNSSGQSNAKDCKDCDAGFYCAAASSPKPNGPCAAGYFCTTGSSTMYQHPCPNGTYCLPPATEPVECPIGSYQPAATSGSCLPCRPGFTCPYVGMVTPLHCPKGSYCPSPYPNASFSFDEAIVEYIGTYQEQGEPCPLGTFNNATDRTNIDDCLPCPTGMYCNILGATEPSGKCSAGYICYKGSSLREPSQDGNAAVNASVGERCHAGKYCEEEATSMIDCLPGTYNPNVGARSLDECLPCSAGKYCNGSGLIEVTGDCDPGYYCSGGASSSQPKDEAAEGGDLCSINHYCNCDGGCSEPVPCLTGLYANRTGMTECLNCPPGYFCVTGRDPELCSAGSYCIGSSGNNSDPEKRDLEDVELLCPVGTYSNRTGLSSQSQCTPCDAGYFCGTPGLTKPSGMIAAGWYANGSAGAIKPSGCSAADVFDETYECGPCPVGSYCPEGSPVYFPCPKGTFSNEQGVDSIGNCELCTPGYYCSEIGQTTVSEKCFPGFYCTGRSEVPNPNTTTGWGDICPLGHSCPEGSATPIACLAGTYADVEGLADCKTCKEGFYCVANSTNGISCPAGNYCPNGTKSENEFRCPAGTYRELPEAKSVDDCSPCPTGRYCNIGATSPSGNCSAGYYCTLRATMQEPVNATAGGGRCSIGEYCPEGTPTPIPCTAGWYCEKAGLPEPTAMCDEGFFCSGGSTKAQPDGTDSTGGPCPAGRYCPRGSAFGKSCIPGTFVNTTESKSLGDCMDCDPGKFCDSYNLTSVSGPCSAGYYCPGGQNTSTPVDYICDQGYHCPSGSSQQYPCGNGTYQNLRQQGECKLCPAGFYCDATPGPVISFNETACRKGYYCPEGTAFEKENPCLPGTYNNKSQAKSIDECTPCTGGYYCDEHGTEEPSRLCSAGYFCNSGATSGTPAETSTTGECPLGFYCPEGTVSPQPCPPGSYGSSKKLGLRDECMECPIGEYCAEYNMTATSGPCDPGYFCPANSTSRQQEMCGQGKFCPGGTIEREDCPIGKFSNQTNLASVSECSICTAGKYCDQPGLPEPAGDCAGGYYCPEGSTSATPNTTFCQGNFYCPNGTADPKPCEDGTYVDVDYAVFCPPCPEGFKCNGGIADCSSGFYCPAGTGVNEVACPKGTYNPKTNAVNISQCLSCPGGRFCETPGSDTWTGYCDPGYYCVSGMDRTDPDGDNSSAIDGWCFDGVQLGYGGRCPPGSYCERGSTFPVPCPPGNFSSSPGQASCEECPTGYFCEEGTSNFTEFLCPSGYFCPKSTTRGDLYPCPAGTYNNETGKSSESDCVACPGGMYCPNTGTTNPVLSCQEGYYCPEGSISATNYSCSRGYYCPEGSPEQILCTAGFYCDSPLLANVTRECDPGYYCQAGASYANGSDSGGECPTGSYCPRGSKSPKQCPAGTYRNETRGESEDDCVACDPRYFCSEQGADSPKDLCDPGYYCDGTTKDITSATPPAYKCFKGHRCPLGSIQPVRCDSGYYQDEEAQATCKVCLEGYYCDNTIAPVVIYNESSICPMGHFCPNGTERANQFPCPSGTFRNDTGGVSEDSCMPCIGGMFCETDGLPEPTDDCDPGFFCKSRASSSAPAAAGDERGPCPPGFYCERKTTTPTPCGKGTYNPQWRSTNSSACLLCTQGNYCPFENMTYDGFICNEGYYCQPGSESEVQVVCEAGFYCEAGKQPQPCPRGTWSNRTGLSSETNCTVCPAGFFCPDFGQTSVNDPCLGGYYCGEGQSSSFDNICPYGVHCPNGTDTYLKCLQGTFTDTTGQSSCQDCPSGFYCVPRPADDYSNIQECPRGYFCPNGTGLNWQPCPPGTFSNVTMLSSAEECQLCDAGLYCDGTMLTEPNGECEEGYFCTVGVNTRKPSNGTTSGDNCTCSNVENTGWGGICPLGFFCPTGSTSPSTCDNGTYADEQGLPICKICEAGFYCPPQSETYIDKPCPSGHYCPAGTEIGEKFPCPPGSFNPNSKSMSEDACTACRPGEFCSTSGMSSTNGNCSDGYYCSLGSTMSKPTNPIEGGECGPGFYCPSGASSPYSCPVGWYCQDSKLPAPEGLCAAGYYCVMNATRPQPDGTDDTGYPCPEGYYCTAGTESISECPKGTFGNVTGLRSESECSNCSAGMFCNTTAALSETGPCSRGYYCPGGNIQPDPPETPCPAGYFCPEQSDRPRPCESGYYQDEEAKSECKLCPAGCVCNATLGPVTSSCAVVCPEGHYCPNGTRYEEEFPCPQGTYFNGTGLQSRSNCLPCLATFACDTTGISYPTTKCNAGYYCRSSADSTTPNLSADLANECPPGFYCPEGTAEPIGCPIGTYSNSFQLMNASQCTDCTAGHYCDATNLTSVAGDCKPGFYCPTGSSNAEERICDRGSYCRGTSGSPTPCPVSTFSNAEGLSSESQCLNCTAGFYCEEKGQTNVTGPCLAGYYCPLGSSSSTQERCPIGMHCPAQSAEPAVCSDGFYAPTPQLSTCEICPERFYCLASKVVAGDVNSITTACDPGYFCPNGTGLDLQPCPQGTYSPGSQLAKVEECTRCDPGKYCEGLANTTVTGDCSAGHYCESGVWNAKPITPDGVCNITLGSPFPALGNICPPGSFCPSGIASPQPCEAGSYMSEFGASSCFECPAGYFCLNSTIDYSPNICPEGHYCPNGTDYALKYPCPVGTYNNLTTQGDASSCLPCPPGRYCNIRGTVDPDPNKCEGGYYCTGGATTSQDGEECEIGYYCPIGTLDHILCPAGYYCESTKLSNVSGRCQAGYYCPNGSVVSIQEDCPQGFFCEEGTPIPEACPAGTFRANKGAASIADCTSCTGGYYCASEGRDAVTDQCDGGYYCPGGDKFSFNASQECWLGHHCPVGSREPVPCNAGFFQNRTGQSTCQSCPEGYYCPPSTPVITPTLCPDGSYCPIETPIDNGELCPPGTYNNNTGRTNGTECLPCFPKYFCPGFGNTEGTGGNSLCSPGYYCDGGASSSTQHDCPLGSYCIEGSAIPTPCPAGTTLTTINNKEESDCNSCAAGFYCPQNSTSTGAALPCDPGFVCSGGAFVPNPVDNTTGYECPPGYQCPGGTPLEQPCAPRTYQPLPRNDTCLSCDAGSYCPDPHMTDTIVCPQGSYCEGNVVSPSGCPSGTYSNLTGLKSRDECLGCPPGRYCNQVGLIDPSSNLCTAGFICNSNATSSNPPDDGTNGPCPAGYYCPEGTQSPIECPVGTIRSVVGGASESDCQSCPAGQYCDIPGQPASSGDCSAGYYCPANAKISSPEPSEYQCPPGSYCGNRTSDPTPCDPGTYQPNEKSTSCLACEIGYYCLTNTSVPEICPVGSYCPAGSAVPISCPDGYYGNGTGLQTPQDCSACITGYYCTGGNITAPCTAGYFCRSGNPTPTPDGSSPAIGEPCPFGYYCLEGTIDPSTCPAGLVISNTGASSVSNCSTCPAGYTCVNSTIPLECEVGHYCPASAPMTPCPVGTFSNIRMATSSGDCSPCTPGYWCSEEGTVDPTLYPCPVGHYCPLGTGGTPNGTNVLEPVPCTPGTYRSDVGAGSIDQCYLCPAGYYCPNSTTVCYNCSDSAITGYVCDSGMYCPAGSATYQWCEAGFYCNETKDKLECPSGYYCPERSPNPTPCPEGSYCDAGAIRPTKCPLGYFEIDGSQRTSFQDTCAACSAGYYGAAEDRKTCTICRAGVICKEAATTDNPEPQNATFNATNSFPCPPGYYCPSGAIIPIACPAGTYNPNEYGESAGALFCIPCPVNYFTNLEGQTACQTCGGQATQPLTGQSSCQCSGSGREFQPSDQNCPCASGYQVSLERNGDCVRYIYEICPAGTSRTQNGSCYDDAQWEVYCSNEVCPTPSDYQGVDKVLGACKCLVDDLDTVCDSQCRARQPNLIEFCCPDPLVSTEPQIRVMGSNGNYTYYQTDELNVINSANALSINQCSSGTATCTGLYITESIGTGFVGAYDPDPTQTETLLTTNSKTTATVSRRRRSVDDYAMYPRRNVNPPLAKYDFDVSSYRMVGRRLLQTTISVYSGILNPVTCVDYGTSVLFSVSNANYPVYDQNNLYNTNQNFDFGGFRDLQNQMQLTGSNTTLFAYQFNSPGVYAFMLSSDNSKKFYVSVMDQGGTCTEQGPYFPPTPLYFVQNGLTLDSAILLAPDWFMIGMLLLVSILVILILVLALILFRRYGWTKKTFLAAYYRAIGYAFNLDTYSSKGATVHSIKKYHPNQNTSGDAAALAADCNDMVDDEFWDHERQIDMEQFSSQQFYGILAKQSHDVTSSVSKQKDEVKSLYQKVAQQTQSLKDLWAAKLNLQGRSSLATEEELAEYERKKEELDIELERRKLLGERYLGVLQQQRDVFDRDEQERRNHQVNFDAFMINARRVLDHATTSLQEGSVDVKDIQFEVTGKAGIIVSKMKESVSNECKRVGAWGVLKSGTGAQLIDPGSRKPLKQGEIFAPDGKTVISESICFCDSILDITVPANNMEMLLANGQTMVIPKGEYFVHPKTGHVLPIQGNLCYDPVSSRIVSAVDSSLGDLTRSEELLIPFIPYPKNESTGDPVSVALPQLERRADLRLGAPMVDAATGLTVPICGVTIHPTSGDLYPVGGSFISPVTNLPTAIEIGSLMLDADSDRPLPILAVGLDAKGRVIPIGGTTAASAQSNMSFPILMSDSFNEPLSGKGAHVAGARPLPLPGSRENDVVPTAGGNAAVLNASVLSSELKVTDILKMYLEALTSQEALEQGASFSVRPEISHMEAALKELDASRSRKMADVLHRSHDLLRAEERADILATSGGAAGMMEFQATGQLLPILVGTEMKDPSGSGLTVPILGVDKMKLTGDIVPLAGSMEEPSGKGLVPIAIGAKAVDTTTAKLGKVVGGKLDPDRGVVVPIVQTGNLVNKRQRKPAPGALAMLEEENASKRGFWRRQRQRESDLNKRIATLMQDLSTHTGSSNADKVDEHLEAVSNSCYQLSSALSRETERRQMAKDELNAVLPPDVLSILCENDGDEKTAEENFHTDFKKLVEVVRNFIGKLQMEEKRKDERLLEASKTQDVMTSSAAKDAVMMRYEQAQKKIQSELLSHLDNRVDKSSIDLATLEYLRKISELLAIEARELLKGTLIVSGDYEVVAAGVYGDDIQTSTQSELVPLLKQLIALLESGVNFQLAPEMLSALQQTHSSQQQVKILETIRETALQQQREMEARQGLLARSQPLGADSAPTVLQISVAKHEYMGKDGSQSARSTPQQKRKLGSKTHLHRQSSRRSMEDAPRTQENTSAAVRDMMERHTLEIAQLEEKLREEEIKRINAVISDVEKKKKIEIEKLQKELIEKLKKCNTDEEKEKVMLEYAEKIRNTEETYEIEKQKRLSEIQKALANERKCKKEELHQKQLREARQAGLDPTKVVPDMLMEDDDQINKDLQLLALQQDKLIAELLKAYREEEGDDPEERKRRLDEEMEAKIRALNSSRAASLVGQDDIGGLLESEKNDNDRYNNMRANMKDKMKMRRARRKSKSGLISEAAKAFNDEEAEIFTAGLEELEQAKSNRIDAAVLHAFDQAEHEKREVKTMAEIERLLSESTGLEKQERDKIMAEYKETTDNLNLQMAEQKKNQRQILQAKLEARKKLKEELAKEKAVAKQMKNATLLNSTLLDKEDKEKIVGTFKKIEGQQDRDGKSTNVVSVSDGELDDSQIEKLAKLEEKHLQEKEQMNFKLQLETEKEKEKIEKQLREQADLQEAAAMARAKSEAEEKNLNEKQTEKLLKQYKKQAEALNKSLTSERKRQMDSLQERMKQKKKMKEEQLAAEQNARFEKELISLKEERADDDFDHSSMVEKKVLAELTLDKTMQTSLEQFVQEVLLPRHLKESTELLQMLEREIEAFKKEAKAKGEADRYEARELVLARQLKEINELLINNAGEPASKVMKFKKQLESKHEDELKHFDAETKKYLESVMASALAPLAISHAQKKLELREKHLRELADTLRGLDPEEMLVKKYADEAAQAAAEAERFRQSKAAEMNRKLEKMKEERQKKEAQVNQKMNDDIVALEKELSSESLLEKRTLEENLDAKAKVALDDGKSEEERIRQMSVDDEERDRLLKQHKENMEKLEAQLEQNRNKARADLQRRLDERRRKKKGDKMTELEEDFNKQKAKLEAEDSVKMNALVKESEASLKQTEDRLKIKQEENIGDSSKPHQIQELPLSHHDTVIPFAPGPAIEDWSSLMMASPFFQELKSVEEVLKKHFDEHSQNVKSSVSTPFIDIQDAQWMLGNKLQVVELNSISTSEFVVYRFGVFITKLMQRVLEVSDVRLLLASQLPNNNYHRNAFRHSVYYQRAPTATLYIRRERLSSVGDLVMVIVHSMAHISVDQMEDDSDPYFLRAFYKGMKTACEDLFFARARAVKDATSQRTIPPIGSSLMPLQTAKSVDEKTRVLDDLMDVKIVIPSSIHFTKDSIHQRISRYEDFEDKQKVRDVLSTNQENNADADTVNARLNKLRGRGADRTQSVTVVPPTDRDLSQQTAKQALKSKAIRAGDAADELDFLLAQNSSDLCRHVEGMEEQGIMDESELPEAKANHFHKLKLRQDHVIGQVRQLDEEMKN